jgi:hypothetical protein
MFLFFFRKIGLQDTTINISKINRKTDLEFNIRELFVFNKEAVLISNTKFKFLGEQFNERNTTSGGNFNTLNFSKLNKFVKDLIIEKSNITSSTNLNKDKDKEKSKDYYTPRSGYQNTYNNINYNNTYHNIENNSSSSQDNFKFDKIYLNNQKIFLLTKSNLIFVTVFSINTSSYLIKLYMLHMYTAFLNFIGETVEMLKVDDVIGGSNNLDRSYNYMTKDFFQIKIFEVNIF